MILLLKIFLEYLRPFSQNFYKRSLNSDLIHIKSSSQVDAMNIDSIILSMYSGTNFGSGVVYKHQCSLSVRTLCII